MKYTNLYGAAQRALAAILLLVAALVTAGFADDRDDSVRIMTRNLYHGTDFGELLSAATFPALVAEAAEALQDIRDSKPAERAVAVAREIVRNDVDIVGLQEVTILRTGPSQLFPPFFQPANDVETDGLELLLKELRRLGEPFEVVAVVPGLDAQLPTSLSPSGIDARITIRDAIIVRSRGSDLRLSNIQMQTFLVNTIFSTVGGPLVNLRGWASVDVEKDGRKFRFATTHLDTPNFLRPGDPLSRRIQTLQANDMINSAGNTNLPVVFVGDFNVVSTTVSDPTYAQFINAGFKDAWAIKRPGDPGFTCCQDANLLNPVSSLEERIDLILFRGGFRVEDIRLVGEKPSDRTPSGLWPSDHAGVVAKLRIPRN